MINLLNDIEAFIERHQMKPSAFGRKFNNDGHFLNQIRNGRDLRMSTVTELREFMDAHDAANGFSK
jgi:ketosteroid isomerase-like protein